MAPIDLFNLYAKIALDDGDYKKGVEGAVSSSGDVKKAVESLFSPLDKAQSTFSAIRHPVESAKNAISTFGEKTESLRHPIEAIKNKISEASAELETQRNKMSVLTSAYDRASAEVKDLTTQFNKSVKESGSASKETQELAQKLSAAEKAAAQAKDDLDTYAQSVKKAGDESDTTAGKAEGLASKLKSGLAGAGKIAGAGIAAIGTAAGAAITGLLALEESTEEYRIAQGKLNTAFESAGFSADTAQEAYNGFYAILGDTDTATEASQLLAKLAKSEEDVSKWTDIAAGVSGTFGDSLPIEGLIEASNETAKVGQVTGSLADALNWAGISEDDFNKKLAACGSESERNKLIMNTLSKTYDKASDAFYKNNEALVESRNNQAMLDATLATLGQTVSNVKNRLMSEFLPAISDVATAFSGVLEGTEGADEAFGEAVEGLVNQVVSKLPEFLNMGIQILLSLANGIIQSVPTLVAAIPEILNQIISAFGQLLPQLLGMGIQLLDQLATGIETELPNLIARLPQIIEGILNYITENLPALLAKGEEILTSLLNGLVNSIPKLVQALPRIITSITQFIATNLPKIIQSGINILLNLLQGIMNAIPDLVAALPDLIGAIVDGLGNLASGLWKAGENIVQGIIDGIAMAWDGLVSWFSNLWDSLFGGRSVDVDVNASSSGVNGSHAAGLDYVPYNGYIAELHRGETVLTRAEAEDWRRGKNAERPNVTVVQNIYSEAKTAAQLMREARWEQERAVLMGV